MRPQVVAGTSIGALVGGAYVTDTLNEFADWVQSLTVKDVFGLLDISLSGGMVKGRNCSISSVSTMTTRILKPWKRNWLPWPRT